MTRTDLISYIERVHPQVFNRCVDVDISDYTNAGGGEVIERRVFDFKKFIADPARGEVIKRYSERK